jgi:hypothetical protein
MSEMEKTVPEEVAERLPKELAKYKKFLKTYVWPCVEGKIVVIPKLTDYGESIDWDARIHKDGVIGPMRFTVDNAKMINASSVTIGEVKMTMDILERDFKSIPGAVKVELAKEAREAMR